ncbi:hypothetical protein A0H76_1312 [Hepatospora eriocheir]|uniref:Uncharacterized protein n=1 Tax=Hepatospora eriocheir TaxID=1081669 RepID=A0A1X0QKR6_9MICR|nr:hypothetical protein A0H76_1312 [Hepatospora eriocheir]
MIGMTPNEVVYGINIFDPLQRYRPISGKKIAEHVNKVKAYELNKVNENRKNNLFAEGDFVYRKLESKGKFETKWIGSYLVKEIRDQVAKIENEYNILNINIRKLRHI